mmetsp:Transcript_23709/g.60882  ORF Transcript_23709/g.60882 Transcript_23709/m.60882 type:complete len:291 (-) Transcript_23709:241-1113(-)
MLSETVSIIRCRVSMRCQPMCGVNTTLCPAACNSKSGLSTGSGSTSCTSSAAPAMTPARSASTSSASRTIGPRAVLMRYADGFIAASSAVPIMPRVCAFSGQWMDTKSLARSSVGTSTTSTPGFPIGAGLREETRTFMPKASAMSVTRAPMVPRPPMSPSVLPCTSKCGRMPRLRQPIRSPSASLRCCCMKEQLRLSIIVMAMCAIASVLYTGMLDTTMPRLRATSISMLLNPVPASQMILTLDGSCSMTLPGTGISLVISISAPAARPASSLGAVSPCCVRWVSAFKRL